MIALNIENITVSEAADETAAALGITAESTDNQLIVAARTYARAVNGHVKVIQDRKRRALEDFWRLGRTLNFLFQRRSGSETWAETVKEIGISATTDNHARRLANSTTFNRLETWKHKTEALERLGIITRPAPQAVEPIEAQVEEEQPDTQPIEARAVVQELSQEQSIEMQAEVQDTPEPALRLASSLDQQPSSQEMLLRAVQLLEECGPLDSASASLLSRAADLIADLSARMKVAA